ncbi:helix-turn-helix transcriptional regulator [Serratia quinivorans]|uniref:helix-turn-helix domain-containing protein n=1 Tax=Serratia quinivorans TaxID=137545 RepID=UPI002E76F824|nr:helix-turn-helix transcriptional regulator [Serratia quinivorans]
MITSTKPHETRTLTDIEIADCVKLIRKNRNWSQEQLAAICDLSLRTIQRVEKGEPSTLDTRRALARAFEANDIDAFNKPINILSDVGIKNEQEKIENSHTSITATKLTSGRVLLEIAEDCLACCFYSSFDMNPDAEKFFASLKDYFQEYSECHDLYSNIQKIDVEKDMQSFIKSLNRSGVSLVYANTQTKLTNQCNEPIIMKAVYICSFPIGKEPETLLIPKEANIRW